MTYPAESLRPASAKRQQRFLRFQLQPGDEALLDHLSENQRALLLSDGSYKERAERFGLPVGTVRSRLHRARAMLEQLRQDHRDAPVAKDTAIN